jgi:hypothetical protein
MPGKPHTKRRITEPAAQSTCVFYLNKYTLATAKLRIFLHLCQKNHIKVYTARTADAETMALAMDE